MQTFDDVARLAAGLPEVTEGAEKFRGQRAWLAVAPPKVAEGFLNPLARTGAG